MSTEAGHKPIPEIFKQRIQRLNIRAGTLMETAQSIIAQARQAEQQRDDMIELCRQQMGLTEDWELKNIEHGFVPKEEKAEE